MNKPIFYFTLLIILISVLSCTENKDQIRLLGELPSIAKDASDKINDFKLERELSDTQSEKYELDQRIEELISEAESSLKESFNEMNKPAIIPVEQQADSNYYEIIDLKISSVSFNKLHLEAAIKSKITGHAYIFTHIRFIDKDGKEIKGWAVLISPKNLEEEEFYTLTGVYNNIENLVNLEKAVIRSFDEYEMNKYR